jgi:hypothetical protein
MSKSPVLAILGLSFLAACAQVVQPPYEERGLPVTIEDLRIIDRATAILDDEKKWNRRDTRECPPKAPTMSLFCALNAASIEVIGQYDHRRVAIQEVRFAVKGVTAGREFDHRLMDFNNLRETTIKDIRLVLSMARENIKARLKR